MKRHAMLLLGGATLALTTVGVWYGWTPATVISMWCVLTYLPVLWFARSARRTPDRPLDRQSEVECGEFALCVGISFGGAALWANARPLATPDLCWTYGLALVGTGTELLHQELDREQRRATAFLLASLAGGMMALIESSVSGLVCAAGFGAYAAWGFIHGLPVSAGPWPITTPEERVRDTTLRRPASF